MLMANVLKNLIAESSLLAPDFRSFRRQEYTFVLVNLFLLGSLIFSQLVFASYFGPAPRFVFGILAAGILVNGLELLWIKGKHEMSAESMAAVTWAAITLNIAVAAALAFVSYRQDVQYFALMISPVFQAAFRLTLGATILTLVASNSLVFFWVWNYFRLHPPSDVNEYIEAATISLIYWVAGLLVWALVNHLRSKQTDLATSLVELERAKEKLMIEEKLAAVGRFSTAIAHEIRNPVAMISSALSTAFNRPPDSPESQEMFEIAAREAARLEKLTTDFLAYAKPRPPSKICADVADSIGYVADICRPLATERAVSIRWMLPSACGPRSTPANYNRPL